MPTSDIDTQLEQLETRRRALTSRATAIDSELATLRAQRVNALTATDAGELTAAVTDGILRLESDREAVRAAITQLDQRAQPLVRQLNERRAAEAQKAHRATIDAARPAAAAILAALRTFALETLPPLRAELARKNAAIQQAAATAHSMAQAAGLAPQHATQKVSEFEGLPPGQVQELQALYECLKGFTFHEQQAAKRAQREPAGATA